LGIPSRSKIFHKGATAEVLGRHFVFRLVGFFVRLPRIFWRSWRRPPVGDWVSLLWAG